MSKVSILFFVAVVASATYAVSLGNQRKASLQEAKDECVSGITETFDEFKKTLRLLATDSNKAARNSVYDRAVVGVRKIIEDVNDAGSLDSVEESQILPNFPLRCPKKVSQKLAKLLWKLVYGGTSYGNGL